MCDLFLSLSLSFSPNTYPKHCLAWLTSFSSCSQLLLSLSIFFLSLLSSLKFYKEFVNPPTSCISCSCQLSSTLPLLYIYLCFGCLSSVCLTDAGDNNIVFSFSNWVESHTTLMARLLADVPQVRISYSRYKITRNINLSNVDDIFSKILSVFFPCLSLLCHFCVCHIVQMTSQTCFYSGFDLH